MSYTKAFIKAYERSLEVHYRYFYDDFNEYGNKEARQAIYFIGGIGGVPGQIRFAFPSIIKYFGTDIYIRSLSLKEFSAKEMIFNKYTLENMDKRREKIVADLNGMGEKYQSITIVASSNGFYDFLYAYAGLSRQVLSKSELIWCAVAPDHFEATRWEGFFYRINGFTKDGHRWFAFPNANWLEAFNPELKLTHQWKFQGIKKTFYKYDLEFRFRCLGLWWGYTSVDCFNAMLSYMIKKSVYPINMKSYILVATNDGYWQGKTKNDIERHLNRYLSRKQAIYKPSSHLWLLMPEHISQLLSLRGS